jgi:hypothetical protein
MSETNETKRCACGLQSDAERFSPGHGPGSCLVAGKWSAEALTSVDYDGLGEADKIKHNVGLSLAGALRLALSPSARRRVTGIVTSTGAVLPSGDMVKLFEKVK